MAIVKWEPFKDFEKMFDETFPLITMIPAARMGWDLGVDVYEEKGNIVAEMNLPGIKPENVHITFENGGLKVTGSREQEKETKEKNFYCKEIKRGKFEKMIELPAAVQKEKVEAIFKNGVLRVVIPKKEEKKQEPIQVKIQ